MKTCGTCVHFDPKKSPIPDTGTCAQEPQMFRLARLFPAGRRCNKNAHQPANKGA